jgi:hypothetical protein
LHLWIIAAKAFILLSRSKCKLHQGKKNINNYIPGGRQRYGRDEVEREEEGKKTVLLTRKCYKFNLQD